jgi:hypothetical protein
MLETIRPVQFHQGVKSGRTKTSRLTCEKVDGSLVEVIAKFSAGCDLRETSLAMEVIAASLALDVGLPAPSPYLITFDEDWIQTITDDERRQIVTASNRIAFGATDVGNGFRIWTTGDSVTAANAATAAAIFAFDGFIANPDRSVGPTPNCLIKGSALRIIDHEAAFFYRGILGWVFPWQTGGLSTLAGAKPHIFFGSLRRTQPDLTHVRDAWSALPEDRVEAYREMIPTQWGVAESAVEDAIRLIQGVRANLDDALTEVRRVLT